MFTASVVYVECTGIWKRAYTLCENAWQVLASTCLVIVANNSAYSMLLWVPSRVYSSCDIMIIRLAYEVWVYPSETNATSFTTVLMWIHGPPNPSCILHRQTKSRFDGIGHLHPQYTRYAPWGTFQMGVFKCTHIHLCQYHTCTIIIW